ncbi:condensation domain-containing protein [Actinokineospora sp. G85]|uniref:condensation domain-containing protein n=1 Tax=Actinokineospora sp. G85 TaxID=3406626 RepID=UPI003C7463D9
MRIEPTALQEAVWWVCKRAGDQSVYNITWRLGCETSLDLTALRRAWQVVVDRHEALRLSFHHGEGALSAGIQNELPVTVPLVEVADPGSTPVDALLRTVAEESHREPFTLDRAPLARLTAVRVGDRHELIITVHHMVVDGWGIQLLFDDLAEAYRAAVRDQRPGFTAQAPSWREFALEEQAARVKGAWQSDIDYWRTTLDGASAATVIGDRGGYAGTGGPGTTLRHTFSDAAVEGLTALAKSSSATPFAVLLAAMQVLFARSGAGGDVVVGVVAANRMSARDQQLIGYLVNLCMIRAEVSNEDTLAEVVAKASAASWEMFAHQAVPYPAVFSALDERTRSGLGDIAPVMLNYLGTIGHGLRLDDVGLTLLPSPNVASRTDIGLGCWKTETGGLMAEAEYSTTRYDEDTVSRLLSDLDAVLSFGAVPTRRVGDVRVSTKSGAAREDHRVVAETAEPPAPEPAPAEAGERIVSGVWTDVLGSPPVSFDEDFFAAGGHSLNAVEFMATLVESTGADLDLAAWLAEPTPRNVLAQLGGATGDVPACAHRAADQQSTVVSLRPGQGRHLHLFAGEGGSAEDYHYLIDLVPPDWRITFSEEREPLDSVPDMAARFRQDLEAGDLRPDVLAGWSMGGQLAFEVAAGYGDAVPGVVLIDAPPPSVRVLPTAHLWQRLIDFAATVCLPLGVRLDGSPVAVPDDPAPAAHLVRNALLVLSARLRAVGHDLSTRTLTDRWHTYEQKRRAADSFVSDRVLAVRAAVLAADLSDDDVTIWTDRFVHTTDTERLDVGHHSLLRAPAVESVAAAINRVLD